MSFTKEERKTLADLNYLARVAYKNQISPALFERLRLFSVALIEDSYKEFPDPNKAELVSIMASTADGKYWRAVRDDQGRNILDRLANELGVVIAPWTPPTAPPIPPATPEQPPVTPTPPVSQAPSELQAALEARGFEFSPTGQIKGFLLSSGAEEGAVPGYVGMDDAGLRLFSNIARKIGLPWPNVNRNPNLPTIMGWVTERDGGLSCDYEPPLLASDPNPRPNKTLVLYLQGFLRNIGPRGKTNVGKFIDFCGFEKGRGFRFNTRRTGSSTPDIDVALQLDADLVSPVVVKVGGQLRRLVVGADGRPDFGEVVDEHL